MEKLKPEITYFRGDSLVPAKALEYKKDVTTGEILEKITPRTQLFEKNLNEDLLGVLKGESSFPTAHEVFVSIVHFLNSGNEYARCDLDNRAKTILDALKGAVYVDDSQVRMLWTHKFLQQKAQENSYRISVKLLDAASVKFIGSHLNRVI